MIKINKLLKKHRNDWNSLLKEAIRLNEEGSPGDAALIYEAFLDRHPNHSGVLENLATSLLNAAQFRRSVQAFKRLISQTEPKAHVWLHRGIAEARLKDTVNAELSFQEALRLNPDYALAHNNLGKLQGDQGFLEKALESYGQAIALDSNYLDARLNRGITLQRLCRDEEAIQEFTAVLQRMSGHIKAQLHQTISLQSMRLLSDSEVKERLENMLEKDPGDVEALNHLGLWWLRKGMFEEALEKFLASTQRDNFYAPGFANQGNVLNLMGRHDEAIAALDRAIILEPLFAEAFVNRITALQGLGLYAVALESGIKAIAINPALAEGYSNLGLVFGDAQHLDDALSALDRAIRLKPLLAEAYHNLAEIHRKLGSHAMARSAATKGVVINPALPQGCVSYALVSQESLELDRTRAFLDRALLIAPNSPDANFSLGQLQLLEGKINDGTKGYEWRWKGPMKRFYRKLNRPLWLGEEPVNGKSILVVSEQGLGDAIQAARYLPAIVRLGAEVYVELPTTLLRLFESLEGKYHFVERGQPLPETDFQCPIMSLPRAFKTEITSIPESGPYLTAQAHTIEFWKHRLGAKIRPRIGLAFSGNAQFSNDRNRSIPLAAFESILGMDAEFHVVQKDVRAADAAWIADFKPERLHQHALDDMMDTAGLLMAMDLVVSVDTSIAHLSGALGAPVWILLSRLPDPRWLLERKDSPWYPSARLFRQTVAGNWGSPLVEVETALREKLDDFPSQFLKS